MACGPPSAASGPLPFFQFRPRLESVDWRRLSAIDVDKVAGAVDVLTLQENIMNITFCKLEDEKCPHCQSGVDPVLLKLIRLAQLTIEYLLHSQEFLTSQLHGLEERLHRSLAEGEHSKKLLTKQAGEIKLLKEECKRRKKLISTQQLMIEAKASYYQCHFCDKAFMNQAFLQSHIQRRHPEDSHLEYKTRAQTDKLQSEIDMLKEQLQLTKSQLEAAQHAHAIRLSKEYEMQKTKEEEFLKLFDRWKEEEKEKLVDEMEKVKEMFMKEFKELTSKNSALEYQLSEIQKSNMQIKSNIGTLKDAHEFKEERPQHPQDFQNVMQLLDNQESKWTARVQALHQEHKKEKSRLLSHIEKLRTSMIDDLNASNVFYKKRIEELGQRLQEQNELIITQRQQIKEFTSKPLNSVSEPKGNLLTWQTFESKPTAPTVPMNAPATQTLDAKSSLPMAHGKFQQILWNDVFQNCLKGTNFTLLLSCLYYSYFSSLIEQAFSSHILEPIEELSEEEKGNHELDQGLYLHQSHLDAKTQALKILEFYCSVSKLGRHLGLVYISSLSVVFWHLVPNSILNYMICSCWKYFSLAFRVTKNATEDHLPRRSSTIVTPPFSSEEELDADDLVQAFASPDVLPVLSSKSNKSSFGKSTVVKSDTDWTEGSEIEDSDISPKPTGTSIKTLTGKVEKTVSNHRNMNKPVGGINVADSFIKKELKEDLKCTDVDDDDWDISSLEEDRSIGRKAGREQKEPPPPVKNESNSTQVPNAWVAANPKGPKGEGLQFWCLPEAFINTRLP
ncbi:hypothetical protein E5288_WYG011518 [Bos mutus]|uniref:Cilium assembly protein DZIP1 n=1 Tax=Bos mutus TaxID=72004 RepID=A0A6B0RLB1_9CETA|nr:hypothetical protein [Bos mutus]